MKLKFLALSLLMVAGVNMVNAQNSTKDYVSEDRKHDILGMGIADAVLGSKRSDSKTSLTYGFGYRYSINRFRLGADLGFGMTTSKLALAGENSPSIKEKDLRFLVLPTAEFVYFKRRLVELYGSAAAGVNLSRHSETALAKNATAGKSTLNTDFAYQVNPIALRVDIDRVGGFVEAGLGTKGFVTAGVSFKF